MSRNALLFSMQGLRGASPCVCYHSPQEPFRLGVERVPAGADGGRQRCRWQCPPTAGDADADAHAHAVNGEVVDPSMFIDAPEFCFTCGGF